MSTKTVLSALSISLMVCGLGVGPAGAQSTDVISPKTIHTPFLGIKFRIGMTANLFRHLDCLSGRADCDRAAYERLWTNRMNWTGADDEALDQWRKVGDEIERFVRRSRKTFRFEQLALGTNTLEQFKSKTHFYGSGPRGKIILKLMRKYAPRFGDWWDKSALPKLTRGLQSGVSIARQSAMMDALVQARVFLGVDVLSSTTQSMDLIAYPGDGQGHGLGLGRFNMAEVPLSRGPEDWLVTASEALMRSFTRDMPKLHRERTRALMLAAKGRCVEAAWNLLDEALIVAFSHGLVAEELKGKADWNLAHLGVRAADTKLAAKIVFPIALDAVDDGISISSKGFATKFVRSFVNEFPTQRGCLKATFRYYLLFGLDQNLAKVNGYKSLFTKEGITGFPSGGPEAMALKLVERRGDTAVIMVKPEKAYIIRAIRGFVGKDVIKALDGFAQEEESFVGMWPRKDGAGWILISGADTLQGHMAQIDELLKGTKLRPGFSNSL